MVPLLEASPFGESEFYSQEENLVDWNGKDLFSFRSLEQQYGFVGGTELEYLRYFERTDLPDHMWVWKVQSQVKAIAGFS